MSHTPGPWKISKDSPTAVLDGDEHMLAGTAYNPSCCRGRDEMISNARLIAAAPDGYDLAKHIEAMADDAYFVGHPEWESIVKQAQDFLAKAEG